MSQNIEIGLKVRHMLCCIHGVEQGRYTELVYDSLRESPAECVCCHNVFAYPKNQEFTFLCENCTTGGSR